MGKATHAEVLSAIGALAESDSMRVQKYAQNRIARIGPWAANGRTADDLRQMAVFSVLDGTRTWDPKKVDLPGLLMGAMRSISSAWAAHHDRNSESPEYAQSESGISTNRSDRNGRSVVDGLVSQERTPLEELIRREEAKANAELADQIEAAFAGDEDAITVIAGLQLDMSLAEIRDEYGWEDKRIRSVIRRIKRRAEKVSKARGDHHVVG